MDNFIVEISVLESAWRVIHTVGNPHAAEVFAKKRVSKGARVRVKETMFGRVIFSA